MRILIWLLPAVVLIMAIALFLTACTSTGSGSGSSATPSSSSNSNPDAGPQAIINGQTLATASSHWQSTNCGIPIEVELTLGDSGFKSYIRDSNGYSHNATGNWIPSANGASVTIQYPSGTDTTDAVVSMINIAGSTASAGFVAGVNTGYGVNVPTCVFNLASGSM
jgi:hypothetical protein